MLGAHEDPNGVASTSTPSQPSLPPAAPGTTYAVVSIRVHNLQSDREAPLPYLPSAPLSIAALQSDLPPPTSSGGGSSYCSVGIGQVGFFLGEDPSQCYEDVPAVVLQGQQAYFGQDVMIAPSSSTDLTAYFPVFQQVSLGNFRVVANQGLTMTAAEFASGVPLHS